MPRNTRKELDKMLLEIAVAEGPLLHRVLLGIVGLMFILPENVPEHLQPALLALQEQSAHMSCRTPEEAKVFVMQLVQFRNQLIEEDEASRLAAQHNA
jgi:hypothetical protein